MRKKHNSRNVVLTLFLVGVMMVSAGCLFSGREKEPPIQPEVEVLFEDDFEGEALKDEWGDWNWGSWSLAALEAGKAVMTEQQEMLLVAMSDTSWTDYIVEVDVSVEGDVPISGQGGQSLYQCPEIIFRAIKPDDGEWGYFYLLALWKDRIQLYRRISSQMQYLNKVGVFDGFELGTEPLRVQVKVEGNNIEVRVNGQLCIEYTETDGPLTYGGVGIQSWNAPPNGATWVFDNFKVYQEIWP